jgi:hypothetical protein
VAYLVCPWCLVPQQVDDSSPGYQCITCYGEVKFFRCPHCQLAQTVNSRWTAFTCQGCEEKVDLPRRWGFTGELKAGKVEGTGQAYPKF